MTARRCYTTEQVIAMLQIPRTSFFALKRAGKLPFLEELRPRVGKLVRYRADLIDRYFDNEWRRPRAVEKRSA